MRITDALPELPQAVALYTLHNLLTSLPPPPDDTPEAHEAWESAAIAHLAALQPTDAAEADLAVQIVSTSAQARDSFRLNNQPDCDFEKKFRCRAQASAMLRHSQAGLRTLHRIRADREKAEAAMVPAAMRRAGYWFHDVSVPAPAEPPPPAQPTEQPLPADIEAEADQYAVIYPDRAARIRALGGLPYPLDFGPPEPELVLAIATGTTPALRALGPPRTHATA